MTPTYTFSAVTATDRAGIVWVAAILSLMFSILTLATRLQIKHRALGGDDWFILGGTVIAIGQYAAIYAGLQKGVGRSSTLLGQRHADELGTGVLASQVLYIIALALSKLSVVYFIKRLFTREYKLAWWACSIVVALTVVWGVASCMAISVGCGPETILYGRDRCSGQILRWGVVAAFDVLLEIAYVSVAALLVFPLQMPVYVKATVVGAFAFRLLSAVFAALHAVSNAHYAASRDPGLAIANVLVWQQVHLGYSLLAATIPTLKSFIRGYNKAMGWDPASKQSGGIFGGGYNLGSLTQSLGESRNRGNGFPLDLRPKDGNYDVGAYHEPAASKSARRSSNTPSGASDDPIIRRDVLVTVERA